MNMKTRNLSFMLVCVMTLVTMMGCNKYVETTEFNDNIEDVDGLVANFDSVPPAYMPYEVMFVNTSVSDITCFWDFGDGHTSNQREPLHTFMEAGIYCVTLNVFGEDMKRMSVTKSVFVYSLQLVDASSEVVADFDVLFSCTSPNEVMFINASKNAAFFKWDFGDGYISVEREPIHTYTDEGVYNVALTILGANKFPVNITKQVEVGLMGK